MLGSRWQFDINGLVWKPCKHGFQRWRSNFDEKCVRFKNYGAKNLVKNFWIKVEDCGEWTYFYFCKLQETGMTARWSGSIESLQNQWVNGNFSIDMGAEVLWCRSEQAAHNWQHVTYKLSKPRQADPVFRLWSEFSGTSMHARLQVSTCSGYDLYHPG